MTPSSSKLLLIKETRIEVSLDNLPLLAPSPSSSKSPSRKASLVSVLISILVIALILGSLTAAHLFTSGCTEFMAGTSRVSRTVMEVLPVVTSTLPFSPFGPLKEEVVVGDRLV
ncbi:hypothetical protein HDU98_002063 [Podochytrium sp. JEL0797]|nr:hypothetical protein HDU98_002063 [Podochytrium sp. JEL0797]